MGSDSRRSRYSAPAAGGEDGAATLDQLKRAPLTTLVPAALAVLWTVFCIIVAVAGGVSGGLLVLLWLAGICLPLGAIAGDVLMARAASRRPVPGPEPEAAPRSAGGASESRPRSAEGGTQRRRRRPAPGANPGGG